MRRVILVGLFATALPLGAFAQSGNQQPATPPQAGPVEPAKNVQPPAPEPFTYEAEGRRDPFLSLLGRGADPGTPVSRPTGVSGLLIADVTVKGIVRDKGGYIAMVQGHDSKTYIVRAGDRLFDGSVKSIVADKVVFSQDVNDPLSLVKQREVPKAVRPSEGGALLPQPDVP